MNSIKSKENKHTCILYRLQFSCFKQPPLGVHHQYQCAVMCQQLFNTSVLRCYTKNFFLPSRMIGKRKLTMIGLTTMLT